MSEIVWVLHHLDDVRSDLSAVHRVDDLESMPADRFWLLASRLWCYPGAVAAARLVRAQEQQPGGPVAGPMRAESYMPVVPIPADEQAIAALLRNPLYADLPGMGPAFTHSSAPLAPEPEGDGDE